MALCVREMMYMQSIVICAAALAVTAVLHALAWLPAGVEAGLYNETRRSSWTKYDLPFINPTWTLSLWAFDYLVQIPWLIYAFTLVCRRGPKGYLCQNFNIIPCSVFVTLVVSYIGIVAWLFLWNRLGYWLYSMLCMVGSVVMAFASYYLSVKSTENNEAKLTDMKLRGHVWAVRLLVHNAITLHATWGTVVVIYHAMTILKSFYHLTDVACLFTFHALLLTYLLVGIILDLGLAKPRRFSRILYAPYLLLLVVEIEATVNVLDLDSPYIISGGISAGIVGLLIIVKMLVTVGVLRKERAQAARWGRSQDPIESSREVRSASMYGSLGSAADLIMEDVSRSKSFKV